MTSRGKKMVMLAQASQELAQSEIISVNVLPDEIDDLRNNVLIDLESALPIQNTSFQIDEENKNVSGSTGLEAEAEVISLDVLEKNFTTAAETNLNVGDEELRLQDIPILIQLYDQDQQFVELTSAKSGVEFTLPVFNESATSEDNSHAEFHEEVNGDTDFNESESEYDAESPNNSDTDGECSASLTDGDVVELNQNEATARQVIQNEVTGMEMNPEPTEKSRKRKLKVNSWNRNVAKYKRAHGECYVSKRGNHVPGASLKPPCAQSCRKKCLGKFSEEIRLSIFRHYYELGNYSRQRDFIHSNTDKLRKKVATTDGSRRSFSIKFYLPVDNKKFEVCKTMFLNTLGIKKGVLDIAMKKRSKENTSLDDKRGKFVKKALPVSVVDSVKRHIESFPVVPSHYCRSTTNRKYLDQALNIAFMYKMYLQNENGEKATKAMYRKIFTENYNLGFHRPKKDQCRICMGFENASGNEKISLRDDFTLHIASKDRARLEKKNDKLLAEQSSGKIVSCNFDLQQVLLVPSDPKNNALFYKRRLTTYNFTVYNVVTKRGDCFMWHEAEGGRGSCEIASCLHKYFKSLPNSVEKVTCFSDRCGGQNLNQFVAAMCMSAVLEIDHLKSIDLKFLTVGHSEMECDSMHSAIGTEFKRVGSATWPEDWKTIARAARRRGDKPYEVHNLHIEDIMDWKLYVKDNLVMRKKSADGFKLNWQKVSWLNFEKDKPLTLRFKETFDENFKEISCNKKNRRKSTQILRRLYNSHPITEQKYKDLLSLFDSTPPAIDIIYKPFYCNLPHSKNANDDSDADQ